MILWKFPSYDYVSPYGDTSWGQVNDATGATEYLIVLQIARPIATWQDERDLEKSYSCSRNLSNAQARHPTRSVFIHFLMACQQSMASHAPQMPAQNKSLLSCQISVRLSNVSGDIYTPMFFHIVTLGQRAPPWPCSRAWDDDMTRSTHPFVP